MSELADLQRSIQRHVLTADPAALRMIAGTRAVPASTRLAIYREGYYLRLAEALQATYPALHALLGDAQFSDLARAYIDAHPSRHYSVRYFGHRLAPFLAHRDPYRDTPILTELARWEWLAAEVFDARDAVPVSADALMRVPQDRWPAMRFELHPALRLVSTRWNTAELWSAVNREQPPPDVPGAPRRRHWALWRADLTVYFAEMQRREGAALRTALRGECYADICACAPGNIDAIGAAMWAAQLLRSWVDRGWIVRLEGLQERL